jgi:hypothetical protein
VDVKTQQIRYDLFNPAQQMDLTQALFDLDPDILIDQERLLRLDPTTR